VHPEVPAICFTPICPHSLSFRPLIFSDASSLRVEVAADSRATACVSFDGRNSLVLWNGDFVEIKMSAFPMPCICKNSETEDWFNGACLPPL
jgi:NAD+ kinase